MVYEVGDIVKLKKPHPCGSQEWGDPARGRGLPPEMHGLRPHGDGYETIGGEKHQRTPETGRDGSEVNGDWKRNTKTAGIPDHKK